MLIDEVLWPQNKIEKLSICRIKWGKYFFYHLTAIGLVKYGFLCPRYDPTEIYEVYEKYRSHRNEAN